MARGAKTLSARPPPQAWLANCLDPTARVVTVNAKEFGAMIEARETKTPKSAPRATAKRGRAEGSGAKYTVTEQEGFVWVKCDECSKRRYAPVGKVDASTPDAKWKCEDLRDASRPDVCCETPEDSFPRENYFVGEGVPAPPPGWRREVIARKTVQGADAYYYSPCGKRMRSKPDVQRFLDQCKEKGKYLDVSIDSFDFSTGEKKSLPKAAEKKADEEAAGDSRPAKRGKAETGENRASKASQKATEDPKRVASQASQVKESAKKKNAKKDAKPVEEPAVGIKRGRGRPKKHPEPQKEAAKREGTVFETGDAE